MSSNSDVVVVGPIESYACGCVAAAAAPVLVSAAVWEIITINARVERE